MDEGKKIPKKEKSDRIAEKRSMEQGNDKYANVFLFRDKFSGLSNLRNFVTCSNFGKSCQHKNYEQAHKFARRTLSAIPADNYYKAPPIRNRCSELSLTFPVSDDFKFDLKSLGCCRHLRPEFVRIVQMFKLTMTSHIGETRDGFLKDGAYTQARNCSRCIGQRLHEAQRCHLSKALYNRSFNRAHKTSIGG